MTFNGKVRYHRSFESVFSFIKAWNESETRESYFGRKASPRTSTIVQFIFYFRSFEISVNILRNQK